MGNVRVLAFYITICCIAFVISKIIIAVLLYRRWKRKHNVFHDSSSGGKMVMFRSPLMQSLTSDMFLEKTMKLTNKDIIGAGGYGTYEYFDTGRATMKGDVYSFGVVLLELLTGKRPTDESFIEEGTKLVTWVKAVVHEKREEHVLDSRLECSPIDEVNNVFTVALMCLEPEPSKRPTMAEVLKMLEQIQTDKPVSDS
ncbi:hypothetical protein HHK36_004994 [Tetracentron sinense]|uniref:Protein kinase domain-containing protein n=1 Tax=Tetracentron sinense TaxID=13715 RepID=A0A834ZKG1_TETSI|nr:hypothetical protein HHK36_004994 [Tetracentron sinense]